MKYIINFILSGLFSIAVSAQSAGDNKSSKPEDQPVKYCASIRNGVLVIMIRDKQLTTDATLDNGIKITTDGFLVTPDYTRTALKFGECVDKKGIIMKEDRKAKKKYKKMEKK